MRKKVFQQRALSIQQRLSLRMSAHTRDEYACHLLLEQFLLLNTVLLIHKRCTTEFWNQNELYCIKMAKKNKYLQKYVSKYIYVSIVSINQ